MQPASDIKLSNTKTRFIVSPQLAHPAIETQPARDFKRTTTKTATFCN
jgi:hypothetical protein